MREEKVIKFIGEDNWNNFNDWMRGQTVGIYEDGEINYYPQDVKAYLKDPTVIHD